MSAPYSVQTAGGTEVSVDRSGAGLQLSVEDRHEGGTAWSLTTDLTADEVMQLHGYLGDWLEMRADAIEAGEW